VSHWRYGAHYARCHRRRGRGRAAPLEAGAGRVRREAPSLPGPQLRPEAPSAAAPASPSLFSLRKSEAVLISKFGRSEWRGAYFVERTKWSVGSGKGN
jgi:hypothetical protein